MGKIRKEIEEILKSIVEFENEIDEYRNLKSIKDLIESLDIETYKTELKSKTLVSDLIESVENLYKF